MRLSFQSLSVNHSHFTSSNYLHSTFIFSGRGLSHFGSDFDLHLYLQLVETVTARQSSWQSRFSSTGQLSNHPIPSLLHWTWLSNSFVHQHTFKIVLTMSFIEKKKVIFDSDWAQGYYSWGL